MENFTEIEKILNDIGQPHFLPGPIQQCLKRLKAEQFRETNELETIYHLTESHTPGLRFKTFLQHAKSYNNNEQFQTDDILNVNCNCVETTNVDNLLGKLSELPKEWTIVQLTSNISVEENLEINNQRFHTNSINLTVFDCGSDRNDPILVKVNEPRCAVDGSLIELANEMNSIIVENKNILSLSKVRQNFSGKLEKNDYYTKRTSLDDRLKGVVKDIQELWLKCWRCLFIGKFINRQLDAEVFVKISNYFKDKFDLKPKILTILNSIAKGYHLLKPTEIKQALEYCFPTIEDKSFIKNSSQFLKNLNCDLRLNTQKRYPVILIIDDKLDFFPWEMLDVLINEPVSRVPSFHLLYLLFKTHKDSIVDGYKIVKNPQNGRFILNPDLDLKLMETRMTQFFNYWLPQWQGIIGKKPNEEEFRDVLLSGDIFSYMGHGSGIHLISSNVIQKTQINAVVLLFGCGSSRLIKTGPQVEMYGHHQLYLMARCPCVVGMLWEVTDYDTDLLTSEFFSLWISCPEKTHWTHIDKTAWRRGEKIRFDDDVILSDNQLNEPDLLRALSLAKKSKLVYLTKAACIARGIPVKIHETN